MQKDIQQNDQTVRRVHCMRCRRPFLQQYRSDVEYTLHIEGEMSQSHLVGSYEYRELFDPTPVVACPECGIVLTPASVTPVNIVPSVVINEEPPARRRGSSRRSRR